MSRLQIFELCLHSRQLEEEKRKLSDKDAQNLSELENLRQQLTELMKETQRRESLPAEDKIEVSRLVSAGGTSRLVETKSFFLISSLLCCHFSRASWLPACLLWRRS